MPVERAQVSLLVGGKARFLRRLQHVDVVKRKLMLHPFALINLLQRGPRPGETISLLHGLELPLIDAHRHGHRNAAFPRFVGEDVQHGVGDVFFLVVKVFDPWLVRAAQVHDEHRAQQHGSPFRARAGKGSVLNEQHGDNGDGEEDDGEQHFLHAELRHFFRKGQVVKAGGRQIFRHLIAVARIDEQPDETDPDGGE